VSQKINKKLGQNCHKLAVLSQLVLETLDDLRPLVGDAEEFKKTCKDMEEKCEEILKNVYNVEEVRTSTYLSSLSVKVDTVIRKNLVPMGDPNN